MEHSTAVLAEHDATRDPMPTDLAAVLRALDTMVASAEPAVVFTGAVRMCVPLICQYATVTITGPEELAYAIAWPWNRTDRHAALPFTVSTVIIGEPTETEPGYRGTLTLHFPSPPSAVHAALARLVVDRATALIHRERFTDLVIDATTRAEQLAASSAAHREVDRPGRRLVHRRAS